MTALFESFSLTIIHDIFSLLILTYLQSSQVGKPILDTMLVIKANLSMAYQPRPMVKLNGSTRSWNSTFECTSTTNRTIGSTSFPCLSLHTTIPCTWQPWSPLSLLTRVFIPNSKCPLNLLCQTLLTKSLQISRNYICTSTTRSLVPSNNMRSTLHCYAS